MKIPVTPGSNRPPQLTGWWRCVRRIATCVCLLTGPAIWAAGAEPSWFSLEELGQINVVTASRLPRPAWTTPWAFSVITADDLRLTGVRSLPQALRLAPGIDVAQINSQRHAVAIRGMNGEFSNQLLVVQDGRSLYTPQFLGVFWDAQDVMMEDVDRIEVVRGPGGTAWGINAMSGVVNVITKDAQATQGTLVTGGGGTYERGYAGVRHGGAINANTHYRVYVQAFSRGETQLASGTEAGDDWRQWRSGFRVDARPNTAAHFTLQGDAYGGDLLQYTNRQPAWFHSSGGNLLGRWTQTLSPDSSLQVLSYYDGVRRRSSPATANSDTFAFEGFFQGRPAPRHNVNLGASFQRIRNEALGRVGHNYDPAVRRLTQASVLVADEFAVVPAVLSVAAGTKAEYNTFTHWELLPNLRLTWTPSDRKTGWLAVSRGLQAPDLSSYDLTLDIPGAVRVISLPNRDRPASEAIATEAGWRVEPSKTLSLDAAVFYQTFDKLISSNTTFDARTRVSTTVQRNDMFGSTHGAELAAIWEPARRWRLRMSYALLLARLENGPGSNDVVVASRLAGQSPRHQWQLRSMSSLGENWDFTFWLRHTSARRGIGVPGYTGLDVRLAYQVGSGFECAVVGRDLLDPRHPEFTRSAGYPANSEIPRSVMLELRWTQ